MPSFAVDDVYFTAINDTVLPLTVDTMPVWSGGVLYVPYSVFDTGSTGVSLGTSCIYNKRNNTVSVFSLSKMVLFDLNTGICTDQETGKTISAKAILRNGKAYLPAAKVCSLFGLQIPSYISTDYGYLIRFKTNSVVLNDSQFVDAASNTMNRWLREYQQSLVVPEPERPETSPSTVPSAPPSSDTTTEIPTVSTYLAFRCTTLESAEAIANTLEANHKMGIFFFSPHDIGTQGALIRRLLGSGHSVGILAEGKDFDQTLSLLEEGSLALDVVSHTRTYFALVPKSQRTQAAELGWACWNDSKILIPDGSLSGYAHALKIVRSLPRSGRAYITLDDSQRTANCISTLLQQLEKQNYVLSIPREMRL